MGGGVNPLEWLLPPVAISHTIVDKALPIIGGPKLPGTPGSQTDQQMKLGEAANEQRTALLTAAEAERSRQASDLAARTETGQEAIDARRRAGAANQLLGAGRKRASQTLTDPGVTLSGSS